MQLRATQLSAHLHKGLQPLYAIHGDEALLVQEALDALRAEARAQGYGERSSYTASGAHFDWGGVLAAGQSRSLFAQRQIVEIHIPSGKVGKAGAAVLQQLAQQAPGNDALLLLITLPRLDRATRNAAWFAALDAHGVTLQVDNVERDALGQWIAQRLRHQGQHLAGGQEGEAALRFFVDRVEGNLLAAHQEVQKLALLYPQGELSAQQIGQAVLNVARYDVFQLSQAVLGGHIVRVQRMIDGLRAEGEAEVLVHYALSEDIRTLVRLRDALDNGKPLPLALREERLWGTRERLFERTAPRMQRDTLADLLHAAHITDGIIKGIKADDWPTNGWQALHRLAAELCRCAMAPD